LHVGVNRHLSGTNDSSRAGEAYMPDDTKPLTMTVPEAGEKYYGLGRDASYAAAQRGDIPTIRVGRLLRVPIAAMDRKLESAGRS